VRTEQFFDWQDLFAIVDDGMIPRAKYAQIEAAMVRQAKRFPRGIACLVILPPEARPPPDDIKRCIREVLSRMEPSLTCLGYVVEGTGFMGVAARATLVGMKIFAPRTYPVYVETVMTSALVKMLPHMPVGRTVSHDVHTIANAIAAGRAVSTASQPPTSPANNATSK
jgi:hypothetical protein